MNKAVVLGWLLAVSSGQMVWAQNNGDRPRVSMRAATLEALVPPEYVIESKFDVDLDGDGLPDVAMLIAPKCSDFANRGFPADAECVAEGRMLVVALRIPNAGWQLSASKPIDSGIGVHGDHFYGLDVRGRTLALKGGEFSTTGSRGSERTLQFRFQRGEWVQIGLIENRWADTRDGGSAEDLCPELHLGAGERCGGLRRSTNFNTGLEESIWSIESATEETDGKTRTKVFRKKLAMHAPTKLADVDLSF